MEAQVAELNAAGIDRLFQEQASSLAERAQLDAALAYVRDGDTFVVTKLDRLARSVSGLVAIAEQLKAKGVSLRILSPDIDTGTPVGQLLLNLLAAVAQFEREIMLERQREGIAKAKREGKYVGRQRTPSATPPRPRNFPLPASGPPPSRSNSALAGLASIA